MYGRSRVSRFERERGGREGETERDTDTNRQRQTDRDGDRDREGGEEGGVGVECN